MTFLRLYYLCSSHCGAQVGPSWESLEALLGLSRLEILLRGSRAVLSQLEPFCCRLGSLGTWLPWRPSLPSGGREGRRGAALGGAVF